MYECENCGAVFSEPITIYETHGFDHPPYEEFDACPVCRQNGCIEEVEHELAG